MNRLHNLFFRHPIVSLLLIVIQRLDIAVIIDRLECDVGHSDFFALINIGRTFQHVNERSEHFRGRYTIHQVIAKTGN
ncbi:hypothetical protein D3C77_681810 [compost metagenome]